MWFRPNTKLLKDESNIKGIDWIITVIIKRSIAYKHNKCSILIAWMKQNSYLCVIVSVFFDLLA